MEVMRRMNNLAYKVLDVDVFKFNNAHQREMKSTKQIVRESNTLDKDNKDILCNVINTCLKVDFENLSAVHSVCDTIVKHINGYEIKFIKETLSMKTISDIIIKEFSTKEDVLKIVVFNNGFEDEYWIGIPDMSNDNMDDYNEILFSMQDKLNIDFEFQIIGIEHFSCLDNYINVKILYDKEA